MLSIASEINYGAIDAKLNYSKNNIHIHEIKKKITVYFDDVPDYIQDQFKTNKYK